MHDGSRRLAAVQDWLQPATVRGPLDGRVLRQMTHWEIALAAYLGGALVSLIPVLSAVFSKVTLHVGGPAFEESPHFSPEGRLRLSHNYERMRGTLGFWKNRAARFEKIHVYCMLWIIVLSIATPALTQITGQYKDDPYATWFLTIATLHIALVTSVHKFLKVEVNFKAFRHGESEFYDTYRRLLDSPKSFGTTEEEQLEAYFKEVALIRKQVRNAETDTYAGLEELRQTSARNQGDGASVQKS
jgi:hypothetical protein